FRLLLGYTATPHRQTPPSQLDLADLDAPSVAGFLDHLEHDRGNSVRTRNTRLAAIHSLFGYAALRHPEHAASIQRVLAVPPKRFQRNLITYLTNEEADALLAACDPDTWAGRRDPRDAGAHLADRAADLRTDRVVSRRPAARPRRARTLHRQGPQTAKHTTTARHRGSAAGLARRTSRRPRRPLFPTSTGRSLSRDAVERRITLYTNRARGSCPSLRSKRVTAHTLRHSAAMALLLAGVDITVIALWLGHEQTATAELYLHADMTLKERAIAATAPTHTKPGRYQPPDPILAFLEGL
ncbi:phage integrase family protein, partial [Mycobacterium kansasii 732]